MADGLPFGRAAACLALVVMAGVLLDGRRAAADVDSAAAATESALAPRDAGARYGQALGAVQVCYGSKITGKAEALLTRFTGADQDAFKAQAAKIFDAWGKVKGCVDQHDPNRCKVITDKSCLAAEAEIGGNGSAVPGLVEFAKR